MKKFLVLYRMDMAEMQKMMASTSAEERKKGMGEWEVWMKKNMTSFADFGGPVGKTKQVAATVQLISGTMLVVTQLYRQNRRRRLQPSLPIIRIYHARGYRGGDGDNANAGKVICRATSRTVHLSTT